MPAGKLVNADWLNSNIENKNLLLIDASPENFYKEGHIKGAVNVNIFMYGIMETPVSIMEKMFRSIGIDTSKHIIIYDQGGEMFAPRMFYSLLYHGFPSKNLYILDGGISKWKENGFPLTNELFNPAQGNFRINNRMENYRTMLDEYLAASGNLQKNVLIEALEPEMHYGETQFFDRPGHIPNSVCLPVKDMFKDDKMFKSPDELKKILEYYRITSGQSILTHCGGGVAAAVPFFVFKFILGFENVKLFMESQMGWLKDERNLPFWTYGNPNLLRNSTWVNTWGGNIMRRYGISTVSILDVREPDLYYSGHIQYSVNIPGGDLDNFIFNADVLSEKLGSLGVDINHEAVIVSGGGITKNAALAFALLELLGHKKISILTDPLEKFTSYGYKLYNDTVKTKPLKYLTGITNDIIFKDKIQPGIFDVVYIVSGETDTQKFTGNNSIHLYYKDFLNDVGSPKSAKEIWEIMKNKKIPRYARIICVSADAGEAAVNYFIFRLMGFPDVKMKIL